MTQHSDMAQVCRRLLELSIEYDGFEPSPSSESLAKIERLNEALLALHRRLSQLEDVYDPSLSETFEKQNEADVSVIHVRAVILNRRGISVEALDVEISSALMNSPFADEVGELTVGVFEGEIV